jgi:hypothetical protein
VSNHQATKYAHVTAEVTTEWSANEPHPHWPSRLRP